jgi:hypothetical protein
VLQPTPGDPYTLYGKNQRLVRAELIATGGGQRHLIEGDPSEEACYVACSLAGYAVPFTFSVQKSTGACYW